MASLTLLKSRCSLPCSTVVLHEAVTELPLKLGVWEVLRGETGPAVCNLGHTGGAGTRVQHWHSLQDTMKHIIGSHKSALSIAVFHPLYETLTTELGHESYWSRQYLS